MVKTLLEAGADPNDIGPKGIPNMYVAAEMGHIDTVKALINAGANVNATTSMFGVSILGNTAEEGHADIVELLIQHGADVNGIDCFGRGKTPIQRAADTNQTHIVQLLLRYGARESDLYNR
jgi:ankyrin repeat protein